MEYEVDRAWVDGKIAPFDHQRGMLGRKAVICQEGRGSAQLAVDDVKLDRVVRGIVAMGQPFGTGVLLSEILCHS